MRKVILILVMIVGVLLFFIGALGVFNQGFREEVTGAPMLLIVGLVLMVAATVADRSKKQTTPEEAKNRNRAGVKSLMFLVALIAGAFGVDILRKQEAGTWVNGVLLLGLAGFCLLAAYKLHRKDKAGE